MQYEGRRLLHPPEGTERAQARLAITYLVGTLGMGIVIAIAVFLAMEAGWMGRLQTALNGVGMPRLPSAPQTNVVDVVQGIVGSIQKTQESTTTLWERGSANIRSTNQRPHPGGAQPRN